MCFICERFTEGTWAQAKKQKEKALIQTLHSFLPAWIWTVTKLITQGQMSPYRNVSWEVQISAISIYCIMNAV